MVNVDNDLDSLLDNAMPAVQARELAWRRFGFTRNPFPSRSHPIWDVFYNQTEVRRRFLADLGEFMRESTTVTLFFTGGNRVGKTHFMEYHRRELAARLHDREVVIPMAVTSAQSCDFKNLYSQIIDQVDDSMRLLKGSRLFEEEISIEARELLGSLPPGDFRRAIETVAASPKEEIRLLMRRWLKGERLRAPQRALLGVTGLVDSQSQMLGVLEGLVRFLLLPEIGERMAPASPAPSNRSAHCLGILLFLDEFELVWRARRDRRDQFLQALRALIDSCPRGLLLVVGMATGLDVGMEQVEASYPALYARLKGARDVPALAQIGFVIEAIGYTRAFEERTREELGPAKGDRAYEQLFSNQEIESFFRDLAGRNGSVSQGDFFDYLHTEAERRAHEKVAES